VAELVEFRGYVTGEELAALYRRLDVFALPTSLSEGFPMALMEAMAAGVAIVTTASRGQADHLEAGKHALFVPPGHVAALAEALAHLLRHPALRTEMAAANRVLSHTFDADVVAAEYLEALHEVVRSCSDGTTRRSPASEAIG
jgi:glycosyltransferase involved in cell wall biosynthesis